MGQYNNTMGSIEREIKIPHSPQKTEIKWRSENWFSPSSLTRGGLNQYHAMSCEIQMWFRYQSADMEGSRHTAGVLQVTTTAQTDSHIIKLRNKVALAQFWAIWALIMEFYVTKYPRYLCGNGKISEVAISGVQGWCGDWWEPNWLTRNAILAAAGADWSCSALVWCGVVCSHSTILPSQAKLWAVGFTTRHSLQYQPIMWHVRRKTLVLISPPCFASHHVMFSSSIRRSMVLTSHSQQLITLHYNKHNN